MGSGEKEEEVCNICSVPTNAGSHLGPLPGDEAYSQPRGPVQGGLIPAQRSSFLCLSPPLLESVTMGRVCDKA